METVGYASLQVIPSFKGLSRSLQGELGSPAIQSVAGKAGGKAGGAFTSALGKGVAIAGKAVLTGTAAMGTATAGMVTSLGKVGVGYNQLEQSSRAAFKTLLGSSDKANAMMDNLRNFAKESPFPRQAFIEGAQQLVGFGMEAKNVIPTLSAVQDAVAATGGSAEDIQQVVDVFAKIQGQGKITGEELNRLGERGINAADLIGQSMGRSGNQIRDDISKGAIDADTAIAALTEQMGVRFGGAAANVKLTWSGAVDRISGAWRDMGSALMEPFVSKAGGGAAVEWANTLATSLRGVEPMMATVGADLAKAITPNVGQVLGQVQPMLSALMGAVAPVAGALSGVLAGAMRVLTPLVQGLAPVIGQVAQTLGGALQGALNALAPAMPSLARGVGVVANALASGLGAAIDALAPVLPVLANAIGQIATVMGDALGSVLEALAPVLPPLADAFAQIARILAGILVQAIRMLSPYWEEIATLIGDVLMAALRAIMPILPTLANAFMSILNAFKPLIPVLTKIVGIMGDSLVTVIEALAPSLPALADAFAQIATALGSALSQALTALAPVLPPLVEAIAAIAATLAAGLADILVQLAPVIVQLLQAVMPIVPLIAQLAVVLVSALLPIIQALMPVLNVLVTILGVALVGAVKVVTAVIRGVIAAVSWVGQAFQTGWNAAVGAIRAAASWISEKVSGIVTWFKELPGKVWDGIKSVGEKIGSAFSAAKDKAVEWGGKILDWFKGLPGRLWASAKEGPAAKIGSAFKSAWEKAVEWGKNILDWFKDLPGNIKDKIWNGMLGLGKGIVEAIKKGISSAGNFVKGLLKKIPGSSALKHLPGIGGLFGAAGGYFTTPTAMIIGEAGPELLLPLSDPERARALLAEYAGNLIAPVAAAGPAVAQTTSGGATAGAAGGEMAAVKWNPDVSGLESWVDGVVAAMSTLPAKVTAATIPGLNAWAGRVIGLLGNLAASALGTVTTLTTQLRARTVAFVAETIAQVTRLRVSLIAQVTGLRVGIAAQMTGLRVGVAAQMTGLVASMRTAWTTMAADARRITAAMLASFRTTMSTMVTVGATGGARTATGVRTGLDNATEPTQRIARGYARSLKGALDPVLQGIGRPVLRLPFAFGGRVPGRGDGDTVPAWLTPGEFVVNRRAAARNLDLLQELNTRGRPMGGARGYQSGGPVLGVRRPYPNLAGDTDFLPALGNALSRLAAATVGRIWVTDGYRSVAEQADAYRRKPGLAAPPGRSRHQRGEAADINPQRPAYGGREGQFGLRFPMSYEPWHIEFANKGADGSPAVAIEPIKMPDYPKFTEWGDKLGRTYRAATRWLHDLTQKWTDENSVVIDPTMGAIPTPAGAGPLKAIARPLVTARWGPGEWAPFDWLVNKESSWNPQARNPTSGAFGLPQALPASKIDSHGNRNDPAVQLRWMIDYIAGRYGTPSAAVRFHRSHNWYSHGGLVLHPSSFDRGGVLAPGVNVVRNDTGAPEVLRPAGRSGPAVHIAQATFRNEADVDTFLRKADFLVRAGRL